MYHKRQPNLLNLFKKNPNYSKYNSPNTANVEHKPLLPQPPIVRVSPLPPNVANYTVTTQYDKIRSYPKMRVQERWIIDRKL